ncbi:hypothetical protein ABZ946_23895 [Streptomyces sp. NPDC046324]|uniref:hypothetical protein n=1 Tax=Streptomyces sp. NPDC046324 TaxID=3154915 RepID=UPI0033C6E355
MTLVSDETAGEEPAESLLPDVGNEQLVIAVDSSSAACSRCLGVRTRTSRLGMLVGPRLSGMQRAEVLKRVIGILTEAEEIRRAAEAGEEDDSSEFGSSVVTQMLNEMLPAISVPADATPQEVARLVASALGPALQTMVAGFTLAFTSLAMTHDRGQSDISSAEVLQTLAFQVEAGLFDEGP